MTDLPTFDEFYAAIHDRPPLPWQSSLARHVLADGWPDEIAVETGLGKTACIDIAVWALAADPGTPRRTPTRIWYVVNRRLLVDAALDHGEDLAHRLRDANDGPLAAVAQRLCAHAGLGRRADTDGGSRADPLHIARLRGGAALGARPPEPSQPALVFATVPMFASRWLFRGFGSSTSMRPVDAALAGVDSLVLLDEAHLARPLRRLRAQLAECDPGDPERLLPPDRARPRFVSLTATGDRGPGAFTLGEDDQAHPVVQQRLRAPKPTRLHETTDGKLARTLADLSRARVAGTTASCLVFANTTSTAREAWQQLYDHGLDPVLLTGRFREPEAHGIRQRLLNAETGMRSGTSPARQAPLVVVATQTLEVGADLDADFVVTENAGVRALTQRLGRLNRLGQKAEGATGADLVHVPTRKHWPVYGDEPDLVWERLTAAAVDDVVDLGPANVQVLDEPQDEPERTGEMLPAHLWTYAKTSVSGDHEAPVELFYSGFDDPVRTVSVVWRTSVPREGERIVPAPTQDEAVDVPVHEVRTFLEDREGWVRLDPSQLVARAAEPEGVRPHDVVVLPCAAGGYRADAGWDGTTEAAVPDLSIRVRHHLPLEPTALRALLDAAGIAESRASELVTALCDPDALLAGEERAASLPQIRSAVRDLLAAVLEDATTDPASDIQVATAELSPRNSTGAVRRPWTLDTAGSWPTVRPKHQPAARAHVRVDAFDDLSFDATDISLEQHGGTVGASGEAIARALALPDDIVTTVQQAGLFHDVGKADPRFQRMLGGTPERVLAKSERGRRSSEDATVAGWPRRGRHELLSARGVVAWLEGHPSEGLDPDLLVHLVLSHHGWGRPLVATPDGDPFAGPTTLTLGDINATVDGDLTLQDWNQPSRFRRLCERYGYWGLALLESIVRQADHAASAAADTGGVA